MKMNTRGVTLTELMVSIAVIGLLVSILGVFLIGGVKFYRLTTAKGEIQRDARAAIDLMNRNIRQASAASVILSRFSSSQPPYSMIQFSQIDSNGRQFRFYQSGNLLYMGMRASSAAAWQDRKLADNLRVLFFAYPHTDNETIVSVSLCLEQKTYEGASKTLQLSVEKVRVMNP